MTPLTPHPPSLQLGARCLQSLPPALSLFRSKSPSHQDHLCKHPSGLHAALVKRVIKCESLLLLFPHIVFPSCTSTSGITGCGGICFCCCLHWAVHTQRRNTTGAGFVSFSHKSSTSSWLQFLSHSSFSQGCLLFFIVTLFVVVVRLECVSQFPHLLHIIICLVEFCTFCFFLSAPV